MKATGLSRLAKDSIIQQIVAELKNRPTFFITQHGTLSATSLDKLRAKLRAAHCRYFAVKNSLGKKALDQANLSSLGDCLAGSSGIVFSSGDPALSSKTLVDFAKENEVFKIQRGFIQGQILGLDQIKVLASLPSREVLLAKVLGGMQAPVSRFVGVLSGTLRKAVTVLDAIAKKKANG
jgi:large subunit ribosomal protein L10